MYVSGRKIVSASTAKTSGPAAMLTVGVVGWSANGTRGVTYRGRGLRRGARGGGEGGRLVRVYVCRATTMLTCCGRSGATGRADAGHIDGDRATGKHRSACIVQGLSLEE